MATSEFDQLLARLRELFEQEYHRGEQDTINRVVAAARGKAARANPIVLTLPPASKGRAPRGAPEAFARRVLEWSPDGLALADIIAEAETPEERAISHEAIRIALWRGEKRGWVKNVNGKWVLIKEEEKY